MKPDWLIWQLADSAFPCGGFAHSGGLEAAWQRGCVRGSEGLADFIEASLTQTGNVNLPFVVAANRQPERVRELDRLCDAFLSNHVANRASRSQGQALVAAAEATFGSEAISRLRTIVRDGAVTGHLSPMFGAVTSVLGVAAEQAMRLFLFVSLRGLISSAVRLGVVGPLEGQAIQHRFGPLAEGIAQRCGALGLEDMAQTAPLIDIVQATQDRLYSRLFQS